MLEMLLDKKLLFVLMGMLTGLGVADKCIVSMTMKRMIEAAGSMSKSNHPLMRLVRAKFEHACMISDTVENVGVFVDKYLYEYKVCGLRLHSLRRLEKMCSGLLIVTATLKSRKKSNNWSRNFTKLSWNFNTWLLVCLR